MKTSTFWTSLLTIGLSIAAFEAITNRNGAPNGHTGSTGDNGLTCTACHTGPAVSNQTLDIMVMDGPIAVTEYEAAKTYQVRVELQADETNFPKAGFSLTVEDAQGDKAGGLTTIDNRASGGLYATHTSQGNTNDTGSVVWILEWTSPNQDIGSIFFWVAGNAANGDDTNAGDVILTNNISIAAAPNISTESFEMKEVSAFPSPAKDFVRFEVPTPGIGEVHFYDLTGQRVQRTEVDFDGSSTQVNTSQLAAGTYLVKILQGNRYYHCKVVVQ